MRIPGVKTVKAFSRWAQARILGGAMILGYHRVADVASDDYEVCVSPEHFAEQMEVVSRYARPTSLSQLVRNLKDGSVPARSIAVTFDDGYADNLYHAKPVLEEYSIPATVFVCTGYAGKEFWWDELERLVIHSAAELQNLSLQVGKNQFKWDRPTMGSEASDGTVASTRRDFQRALYNFILPLDLDERETSMKMIRAWAGPLSHPSQLHRGMNDTELLQLAEDGLVEIGSHTRSHPMLPGLPLPRQAEEIAFGKHDLENLLGKPITGFAYPNGRATPDAKQIVKDVGFAYACTSLHDMVRPAGDMFELTRFWQKNIDGERFMQHLKVWMKMERNYA